MRFHISEWEHRDMEDVIKDLEETVKKEGNMCHKQLVYSLIQEIKIRAMRLKEKVDYVEDIEDIIDKRNTLNKELKELQKKLPEGEDK